MCKSHIYLFFISAIYLTACNDPDSEQDINHQVQPKDIQTNLANTKPIAYAGNLRVTPDDTKITYRILATDNDNDRLRYELISTKDGTDYNNLTLNDETGLITLSLNQQSNSTFYIEYAVTDGKLYSDKAKLTITRTNNLISYKTGLINEDPIKYSSFNSLTANTNFKIAATTTLPSKIDLSSYFPSPGNQGMQNSCVAWATGYAVKSYEEKLEQGWNYRADTLFSPSWIYNQINRGVDQGSYFSDALNLIVTKGAATLATMPYSSYDYLTQPSTTAKTEATKYKAANWVTAPTINTVKEALSKALPVIIGITTYDSIYRLWGSNSVYIPSGNPNGSHAVVVVGYDDNKYGGAYKVLNSWGTNWGDNGFFWLPYNVAYSQGIMNAAYIMYDAKNIITPITPTKNLPNLSIISWIASYNIAGDGKLSWKVANTGKASTPKGWNLKLVLSKDKVLDSSDTVVTTETINCCTLNPGTSLTRSSSQGNELGFSIPKNLAVGSYYTALLLDNPSKVQESNENDNISFSKNTIYINNTLPNLRPIKWQANWINSGSHAGKGIINYQLINDGKAPISKPFWVGLFLVNSKQHHLIYAQSFNKLSASYSLSRNISTSTLPYNYDFNLNLGKDLFGNTIPNGYYKFQFIVDYSNWINESNEADNTSSSLNYHPVPIVPIYGNKPQTTSNDSNKEITLEQTHGGLEKYDLGSIDLIKPLNNTGTIVKPSITYSNDTTLIPPTKIINGEDSVIIPLTHDIIMPK